MKAIQTKASKAGLGSRGVIVLLVVCAMVAAFSPGANAVAADAQAAPRPLLDSDLKAIRFDQNLNGRVSPDLRFVDETGRNVRLGDYLGKKPVILVPGYYKCPMLCTLVFNGLVECLGDMRWTIGNQFNVLMVSINPEETPTLAAAKKRTYLKRYGRSEASAGWHFLTGREEDIQKLANEIGFHYAYDPVVKEYAHPSGFVVLTPEGRIARYFFGVTFSPRPVFAAIQGASKKTIGQRAEAFVLLCFHYQPLTGRYGPLIMIILRCFAVATLVFLAVIFVKMLLGEKRRHSPAAEVKKEAAV